MSSPSVFNDSHIADTLNDLHRVSEQQAKEGHGIEALNSQPALEQVAVPDFTPFDQKMVALDQDKAEFMYLTLRALNARRIFEAGTSCGVSTIYLLAAVTASTAEPSSAQPHVVYGTEQDEFKIKTTHSNLSRAFGVKSSSELPFKFLEGDILKTAREAVIPTESLDAVLFDIWAHLATPTLQILEPSLKPNAVLFLDNWDTGLKNGRYTEMQDYLVKKGWKIVSLPFTDGFAMGVRA